MHQQSRPALVSVPYDENGNASDKAPQDRSNDPALQLLLTVPQAAQRLCI
jgi:hypothetical protein